MKKTIFFLTLFSSLCVAIAGFSATKYKCNIQMSSYKGHAAYVVVSLVDAQGKYVRTLLVLGSDAKWYDKLKEWHKAQKSQKENLSAITSASVAGGARNTATFDLDEALLDKGYTIRFESNVENLKYQKVDAAVYFNANTVEKKTAGTGYIKFVKLSKL